MNPSDLHLEDYTFTNVSVAAIVGKEDPKIDPEVKLEDIQFEVRSFPTAPDSNINLVYLKISSCEDKDHYSCLYTFALEAFMRIGFVENAKSRPADSSKAEQLVVINAASILYSAFRERLKMLTSTMIWGQIVLPTANFQDLARIEKEVTEDSDPA